MRYNRFRTISAGFVMAMGICNYLITVALVEIVHEHDCGHCHSESYDCSTCFFIANHLGIALHAENLPNLGSCTSVYSPFDLAFTFTAPLDNIRSRAPPVYAA